MTDKWKTVSLSQLYEFRSGLSKPRAEFGFGFGFLTFKDVLDNFFVPDQLSALVNSTNRERAACSILRGDVFLTRTSETQEDLGMSCVALKDYESATFNGFTKRLRPKSRASVVPEYAAYFFRSPSFRRNITAMSSISTRASLNNEMLERLTIVLPPIEAQAAIGRILKALDDKIELNRRMNRTLEQMAAAIFKAWFVDFEPVKAKAAGATSFPTMPQKVFDALPTKFTDSPLGPLPKGWEISTLGNELDICGGGTPSTKRPEFWDGGDHHFATPKDLSKLSSPILLDTERSVTDAGLAKISSGLLSSGTLLLSSRAPIGYLAVAHVPVAVNQGFIAMKCERRLPASFMLHWCQEYMDAIKSRANGTTFLEVSKRSFKPIEVVVPAAPIVEAFDGIVSPLYERVVSNLHESNSLEAIRDVLLPKLLSGEVRVAS